MNSKFALFRFPYSILTIAVAIFFIYGQILPFSLGKLDEYNILLANMDFLRDFNNLKEAFLTNPFFHKGGEFYRPIQNLSFMIDAHLSGDAGWAYFLTNIILHVAICSLLWYLLTLFVCEKRIALLMALLFAVHPLFVQTVAWAPSRGDMLIAAFGLASIILFLRFLKTGNGWFLVFHILAYGLALFSKESAVLIPVLCYLYLFLFERKKRPLKIGLFVPVFFYLLLLGLFFFIRNEIVHITVPKSQIGLAVLLHNSRTLPELLFKFFFPVGLTPMPGFNWLSTILGIAVAAVLTWVSVKAKPESLRLFLFGISWFILFTAPALVFINKYGSASCDYMEHRGYFPLAGIVVFLSLWLSERVGRNSYRNLPAVLGVLILILGVYSGVYARTYKDSVSYFDRAVEMNPASAVAWYCRGTVLLVERSDYPAALADLEEAIARYPGYAQAYLNRGFCREQMNDIPGAISDYRKSSKLEPSTYEPHAALALLYNARGLKQEAMLEFDTTLKLNPAFLVGYSQRAVLREEFGNFAGALSDMDQVIRLQPGKADAFVNRGVLWFRLQNYASAMADLDQAIKLDGNLSEAWLNRGRILFYLNEKDRAFSDLEHAARLGNQEATQLLQQLSQK